MTLLPIVQGAVSGAATVAWTPASLSGLTAWYKGDAGVTDDGSGNVTAWADQSGNGYTLSPPVTFKPTTGVDTINGINALKFVSASSQALKNASFATLSSPYTIYGVANYSGTNVRTLVSGNGINVQARVDSGVPLMYAGAPISGGSVNTSNHQYVYVFNGASSACYVDGTSVMSGNPGTNSLQSNLWVGARGNGTDGDFFWNGDIGEIVVQSGAASSTDRSNWNTYCARWGL